jgi:hypothetical protein
VVSFSPAEPMLVSTAVFSRREQNECFKNTCHKKPGRKVRRSSVKVKTEAFVDDVTFDTLHRPWLLRFTTRSAAIFAAFHKGSFDDT